MSPYSTKRKWHKFYTLYFSVVTDYTHSVANITKIINYSRVHDVYSKPYMHRWQNLPNKMHKDLQFKQLPIQRHMVSVSLAQLKTLNPEGGLIQVSKIGRKNARALCQRAAEKAGKRQVIEGKIRSWATPG